MEHTARNYHAHGGSEWVVGGKLTFLPGATVEGAEACSICPVAKDVLCPISPTARRAQWPRSGRISTAF